jgi:SAM-dependent methyltransferase
MDSKDYFNKETYLDLDNGYPERPVEWFKQNILPDFLNQNFECKNLLDVGCASGYFTRILSEYCKFTQGVDISSVRIAHAKKYESNKLKFKEADLTYPLDLDKKFDTLFSNAVIPHIPIKLKPLVFKNLYEVASDGASLVLYDARPDTEIVDDFVGIFNEKWLVKNCYKWNFISVNPVCEETCRYLLKK